VGRAANTSSADPSRTNQGGEGLAGSLLAGGPAAVAVGETRRPLSKEEKLKRLRSQLWGHKRLPGLAPRGSGNAPRDDAHVPLPRGDAHVPLPRGSGNPARDTREPPGAGRGNGRIAELPYNGRFPGEDCGAVNTATGAAEATATASHAALACGSFNQGAKAWGGRRDGLQGGTTSRFWHQDTTADAGEWGREGACEGFDGLTQRTRLSGAESGARAGPRRRTTCQPPSCL